MSSHEIFRMITACDQVRFLFTENDVQKKIEAENLEWLLQKGWFLHKCVTELRTQGFTHDEMNARLTPIFTEKNLAIILGTNRRGGR